MAHTRDDSLLRRDWDEDVPPDAPSSRGLPRGDGREGRHGNRNS